MTPYPLPFAHNIVLELHFTDRSEFDDYVSRFEDAGIGCVFTDETRGATTYHYENKVALVLKEADTK